MAVLNIKGIENKSRLNAQLAQSEWQTKRNNIIAILEKLEKNLNRARDIADTLSYADKNGVRIKYKFAESRLGFQGKDIYLYYYPNIKCDCYIQYDIRENELWCGCNRCGCFESHSSKKALENDYTLGCWYNKEKQYYEMASYFADELEKYLILVENEINKL